MRLRWLPLLLCATSDCIITNTTSYDPQAPLTPPRIRDERGRTQPRLGNLVEVGDTSDGVQFSVPVDDTGVSDALQFQFFVNVDRDCRLSAQSCSTDLRGEVPADGRVRRVVELRIPESRFAVGCNRVELWVSSRFFFSDDWHLPARDGDVDFATWWVFKRPRAVTGDAGTLDPVESCAHRVQP